MCERLPSVLDSRTRFSRQSAVPILHWPRNRRSGDFTLGNDVRCSVSATQVSLKARGLQGERLRLCRKRLYRVRLNKKGESAAFLTIRWFSTEQSRLRSVTPRRFRCCPPS